LDFLKLIDLLQDLRQPIDNAGETTLTPDEASKIRELGWTARAGCTWRAPLIPWMYLAPYPWLHALAAETDPLTRSIPWHMRRAVFFRVPHVTDSLGKLDYRILKLLDKAPGHALSRTALQRRLWRVPGTIFNHAVDRLISADRIAIHAGLLYPCSRCEFDLRQEIASRPRRPVPVYTS
jgi:hypothetical protein